MFRSSYTCPPQKSNCAPGVQRDTHLMYFYRPKKFTECCLFWRMETGRALQEKSGSNPSLLYFTFDRLCPYFKVTYGFISCKL